MLAVGDLTVGSHIRLSDGSYREVTAIEVVNQPQQMYNLTVDQAHTFYVGDKEWLVHNSCPSILYHYTNENGLNGILETGELRPSLRAINPNDVRYGNGQYLSDIIPGTKTPAQLSREFLGIPFRGDKFTHYVEIDVTGLSIIQGRPGVFVIPNEGPLNIVNRIISFGVLTK